MQETLFEILSEYGYLGIGFLMLMENIFPPIPSEVVLLFGGFFTTCSKLNIWGVSVSATIGSFLGTCILYGVGRFLNKEKLARLVSGKIGRLLRIKQSHIEKAANWFEKKGYKTVFVCRFIPIVRSMISIPAGMAKMPFGLFTWYTLAGSAIWNIVLVWLGRISGTAWSVWAEYISLYSKGGLIVLAIILLLVFFIHRKRKEGKEV